MPNQGHLRKSVCNSKDSRRIYDKRKIYLLITDKNNNHNNSNNDGDEPDPFRLGFGMELAGV